MKRTYNRKPAESILPVADLAGEIEALSNLDEEALRRRWRRLIGRPIPPDLGRALALRILAYYQQVQHFGDLDRASLQSLAESAGRPGPRLDSAALGAAVDGETGSGSASLHVEPKFLVRPGTLLLREHKGVAHRVMALGDGFAWNGKTYASLSQIAFAITGTHWNGPRFFGLRDKPKTKAGKSAKKPEGVSEEFDASSPRERSPGFPEPKRTSSVPSDRSERFSS
jgi:hypothetical protein